MEHKNFGQKTLIFFFLKRSGILFGLLFLILLVIGISGILPSDVARYANFTNFFLVVIFVLSVAIIFAMALLEYRNFTISIYDRNIKITTGIINRREVGVPYKSIQRVDIIRTLIGQIFGLSTIILTTSEEDNTHPQVMQFSFIDKTLAEIIQKEILEHSQVGHFKGVIPEDLIPTKTN